MKSVSTNIIIVSNTPINDIYFDRLKEVSNLIVVRENEGCDAGSYRDILLNYLNIHGILEYDEIILCNSTFFGFFEPLLNIFHKMELEPCDYWGIGAMDSGIFSYVQAYFLVFRKNTLTDLHNFFLNVLPKEFIGRNSSATYFEAGISKYMYDKGYIHSALIKSPRYYMFGCSAFSVLKDGYPLFKKKAFSKQFYDENVLMFLLKNIMDKNLYDVDLILSSINRSYNLNITKKQILKSDVKETEVNPIIVGKSPLSYDEAIIFLSNEKVYIFGIGSYGMMFLHIMSDYLKNVCGIVVSNGNREKLYNTPYIKDEIKTINNETYFNDLKISEIDEIDENYSVVVAVDFKNSKALKSNFSKFKNVLYLWNGV